jgi:hypothetical protein
LVRGKPAVTVVSYFTAAVSTFVAARLVGFDFERVECFD